MKAATNTHLSRLIRGSSLLSIYTKRLGVVTRISEKETSNGNEHQRKTGKESSNKTGHIKNKIDNKLYANTVQHLLMKT